MAARTQLEIRPVVLLARSAPNGCVCIALCVGENLIVWFPHENGRTGSNC